MITAMYALSKQLGVPRSVTGTQIPHPCGNPLLSPEQEFAMRKEITLTALEAIRTPVSGPTLFTPRITYSSR
ncbi:MAG: hypothetical protein HYY29_04465 [Chloroflexi bacterium]|nr:hypothetical protein [Chloroflexota bacterium]